MAVHHCQLRPLGRLDYATVIILQAVLAFFTRRERASSRKRGNARGYKYFLSLCLHHVIFAYIPLANGRHMAKPSLRAKNTILSWWAKQQSHPTERYLDGGGDEHVVTCPPTRRPSRGVTVISTCGCTNYIFEKWRQVTEIGWKV